MGMRSAASKRCKAAVEGYVKLDADALNRETGFTPGCVLTLRLARAIHGCGTIRCVIVARGAIRLMYDVLQSGTFARLDYQVAIEWKADPVCGSRPYFRCPGCSSTFRSLRGPAPYFACRRCNRLNYHCQQVTHLRRPMLQALKAREQLGCEAAWVHLYDAPPPKPKGMHWSTYFAAVVRLAALLRASEPALTAAMARLPLRFKRRAAYQTIASD